jgi:hypothetical protein
MDVSLLYAAAVALLVIVVAAAVFYMFRRMILDAANREIDRKLGVAQQISNDVIHTLEPLPKGLGQMFGSAGGLIDRISDLLPDKKQRISELQKQIATQQQELINQRLDNERLRLRQIDVQGITQQLRIALLELSGKYDSIERRQLEQFEKGMFSRDGFTEYVGVKSAEYKINIGIDLESLRFSVSDGPEQQIRVHGLHQFEIIGFKDLHIHNRLTEIRKTLNSGTLRGRETQIIESSSELTGCEQEHTQRLLREIQGPQLLDQYVHINARMALVFLKTMLSPKGYDVVETRLPVADNCFNFYQLCNWLNQQVYLHEQITTRKIRENESHILRLQQQLQDEIFGHTSPANTADSTTTRTTPAYPSSLAPAQEIPPPPVQQAPLSSPAWHDTLSPTSAQTVPATPASSHVAETDHTPNNLYHFDPLDPLSMPGATLGNFGPAAAAQAETTQTAQASESSRISRLFSRFTA